MASIIAAFSKPQDAGNIRAILRKNGYEPVFAVTVLTSFNRRKEQVNKVANLVIKKLPPFLGFLLQ